MAANYAFMFTLGAAVTSAFTGSFAQANTQVQQLQTRYGNIAKEMSSLQSAQQNGVVSTNTYKAMQSNLAGQLSQVEKRISSVKNAQENYNRAQKATASARNMFATTVAGGVLVNSVFGSATRTAMNFEFEMAKVKAISGANNEEFAVLNDTAKKLGATTQFTSSEVSAGMRYLAMAGFKTNQIVGAMPGLLSLAAAGSVDLARASDIVSDTMTAFGIAAEKAGKVSDVFAVTITSTNTNVEMLGETMKYAAPVAKSFGVSLEETAAMAGLMANSGIKAGQAGTALRSGMLRLAGPPKMAAAALDKLGLSLEELNAQQQESRVVLKELGINTETANGPRKMASILNELREKMKGLSADQKLATTKAIFGTEGASAWLSVLDQGGEALEELTKKLETSDGAAEKMAKIMQDNAKGALTAASSAAESFAIAVGSTLLPALKDTALIVARFSSYMGALSNQYPTLTRYIGYGVVGLTAFAIAMTGGMYIYSKYLQCKSLFILLSQSENVANAMLTAGKYKAVVATNAVAVAQWALNAAMTANPIGLVIVGIGALVAAGYWLYTNWDMVKNWFITLWDNPTLALNQFIDGIRSRFGGVLDWLSDKWNWIKNIFKSPISVQVSGNTPTNNVAEYAYGGRIPNKTLSWFAERSPEYAIPMDGSSRSVGLWESAGRELGVLGNSGGNNVNVSLSPTITISGNADVGKIQSVLTQQKQELERMLKEILNQRERVSYV